VVEVAWRGLVGSILERRREDLAFERRRGVSTTPKSVHGDRLAFSFIRWAVLLYEKGESFDLQHRLIGLRANEREREGAL
jgi:hypothetical protein